MHLMSWCVIPFRIAFGLIIVYLSAPLCKADDPEPRSATLPNDSLVSLLDAEKDKRLYILPLVSYSPETSLRLGAVGVFLFRGKGAEPGTQLSSIKMPISYTLNNQIKTRMSFEIFLNGNGHILKGYTEWFRYPLLFWGIGANTKSEDEEIYTTSTFGMQLDYLNKVGSNSYWGIRYNWHLSHIVEKDEGGKLIQEGLIPGSDGGNTSGFGVIYRFDRRDNVYNASAGPYLQSSLSYYSKIFGSDFEFFKFQFDLRQYWQIRKKHVLAAHLMFENEWGDPSFETMALLGGDEIMRGHYIGRFRDLSLIQTQLEYRLPIGRPTWTDTRQKIPFRQRWGLVGFAGLGTVAPDAAALFSSNLKYSVGIGFRYLILPKENINVRIDFGFGTQTPGFYLNVREAF